jgi:hypothetical protein
VNTAEQITKTTSGLTGAAGASLELLGVARRDQAIAYRVADCHDTLHGVARQLQDFNLTRLEHSLELLLGLWVELIRAHKIDLVDDDRDELIGKQGLDVIEERDLRSDRVTALLAKVHEVENVRAKMSNSTDGLMLNSVHLLERVVQDTGRIDSLKSQHLVVEVAHVQTLGRERIRLHLNVCPGDGLQERGLADIGEAGNDKCARVGINGGKTTQMLSNLLEVHERILEPLADSRHATQGGALQLLALKQRLAVLQQAHIVTRDCFDERLGGVELPKRNPEVVRIVERVQQIAVERVDILEARKRLDSGGEALSEGLCSKLDLARVESSDSADLEPRANLYNMSV